MKIYKLNWLLLISVFVFISCSSHIHKNINFSNIDSLMNSAVRDSVFPGAVLLFGSSDKMFYSKSFGNYTYDKTSPKVSLQSIFDLASLTKVVGTTSAAMILSGEGKLKLDEKVITYLPAFNNNGKENVTIRKLLLHNSGLPAFKKYYDEFSTAEEVINDIMNLKLDNPPGEKYVYSDLGMITLQKVIESITGKGIDEFLHDNLFTPLEMNNTMYNPSKALKDKCVPTEVDNFWRMRLLQGEVHDERAYLLNGVAGHAGLFSTGPDLSNFATMMLNNGQYKSKQIIEKDIIEEWTTKQSAQSDRALGWDTKSVEGYSSAGTLLSKKSFGHTGYTGTSIWIDPDNNLYIILLSNRVHPTRANRKIVKFRPILHDLIFKTLYQD